MSADLDGKNEMGGTRKRAAPVLYITYDGLLEPIGRSQVVPYVLGVAKSGFECTILSFEKPSDLAKSVACEKLRAELEAHGIFWRPRRYHSRPSVPATAWDVSMGIITAWRLARSYRAEIVHARSYVAGLIGFAVRALTGAKFVFDMRGFWPEERVEFGIFKPNGLLYRLSKLVEKRLLDAADHVVVLTESAKSILREREARDELRSSVAGEMTITVVPCCVDLERFRPRAPDQGLAKLHGLESSIVIGNVGAFSSRYLTSAMFRFAVHLKERRPDIHFVYLTHHDARAVRRAAREAGLGDNDILVLGAEPADVPRWLSLFRLGVFFLLPSYAAKASSYTKLGELLASGVPVVTNAGVGDVERILGVRRCGLVLSELGESDLADAACRALPLLEGDAVPEEVLTSCRATAQESFALDEGVRRYRAVYEALVSSDANETEKTRVAAELG